MAWTFLKMDPVVARRFEALTGLSGRGLRAWLALFAGLHDIGKWDVRFQMKASQQGELLVPERKRLGRMSGYDHGAGGFEAFSKLSKDWLPSSLPIDREPLLALVRAVCAHHGSFPGNNRQAKELYKLRPFIVQDLQAKREFLEELVQLCAGLSGGLPAWNGRVSAQLEFLLAGFTSVCDWVGSQEDWFSFEPSQQLTLRHYWERALSQARAALTDTGLLSSQVRSYAGLAPLIANLQPRAVQALVENLTLPEQPALVVIEDRMGQGKTEAALSLAARWLARGDARAIYLALPTMATANGMLGRAEEGDPGHLH